MTKKVLVPIDIDNPEKKINDFLFPDPSEQPMVLKGIKTDKTWEYGLVILTGEVSEHDILKKIVDGGKKIRSVPTLLETLKEYVNVMPNYKVGNILKLNHENPIVNFSVEYQRLTRKK